MMEPIDQKPKRLKLIFEESDLSKDREDIINFWTINYPGWIKEKFDMFYTGGLYGPAIAWLVREPEERKMVGMYAVFPRDIYIYGKKTKSAVAGDMAVMKDFRKFGTAATLQRNMMKSGDDGGYDFMFGSPNIKSERITGRIGSKAVGRTSRLVKVLKYNRYFKRIFRISFIANFVAAPFNWIFKVFSKEYKVKTDNLNYELLDRFDNRFDTLWHTNKDDYPILGIRDSNWLNWRFTDCPYKDFYIFAVVNKSDNSVEGYFVYQMKDHNVMVADFFLNNLKENFETYVSLFVKYLRTQPVDMITLCFFGDNRIIDNYLNLSFKKRVDYRHIVLYSNKGSTTKDIVMNENNWYYLDGDNDALP